MKSVVIREAAWAKDLIDDPAPDRAEVWDQSGGVYLTITAPGRSGKTRYLAESALAMLVDGRSVSWLDPTYTGPATFELLSRVLGRCVEHEDCRDHRPLGVECWLLRRPTPPEAT